MTQQLRVAGLPQAIEDGYFDTANANKSSARVHGGQSSEFPIYPTILERTGEGREGRGGEGRDDGYVAYISIEDAKLPSIRHRVEYFDHCLH